MEGIWKSIGFKPKDTLINEEDTVLDDISVKDNNGFTPHFKNGPPLSKITFVGLSIRNLPMVITQEEFEEILAPYGVSNITTVIKKFKNSAAPDNNEIYLSTCREILQKV